MTNPTDHLRERVREYLSLAANNGVMSCPGRPEELLGAPIGMYHCEFCGAMVLAGMKHPSDDDVREQSVEPYGEWWARTEGQRFARAIEAVLDLCDELECHEHSVSQDAELNDAVAQVRTAIQQALGEEAE